MTTVRGKKPLVVTFTPDVVAESYSEKILIKTGGWIGGRSFEVYARLEPQCARNLIRSLRAALRQVRDEKVARLNRYVDEAEGPL